MNKTQETLLNMWIRLSQPERIEKLLERLNSKDRAAAFDAEDTFCSLLDSFEHNVARARVLSHEQARESREALERFIGNPTLCSRFGIEEFDILERVVDDAVEKRAVKGRAARKRIMVVPVSSSRPLPRQASSVVHQDKTSDEAPAPRAPDVYTRLEKPRAKRRDQASGQIDDRVVA